MMIIKSPLFWKMLTLSGCLLLLLLPLSMLSSLIGERSTWRDSVAQRLSQSTSGPQRLTGPLIVVPWSETVIKKHDDKEESVQVNHLSYYLPASLKIAGDQQVEQRNIGIYQGQVWRTAVTVNAIFDGEQPEFLKKPGITLGRPWLAMAVGDSRGISSVTPVKIGEQQFDFQPGSDLASGSDGVHVALPSELLQEKNLTLNFSLHLQGTQQLEVVPVGKNSIFDLKSNWPHPGFSGGFLPEQHQISSEGFSARWQSSWFANNINSLLRDEQSISSDKLPAFSAMIVNPVDQYQQTERAVKYAILLIGLTYMAFFLFETVSALRVHSMQYLLVGLSLVMFFLVLLALSEHIGFNRAWLVASITCAAMNGFYLQAVLQGWRRSLCFVAGLLVLDGILWQLLQSEDSALLLGTGVLTVALATVMVMTRNIDWYRLSATVVPAVDENRQEESGRFRLWK